MIMHRKVNHILQKRVLHLSPLPRNGHNSTRCTCRVIFSVDNNNNSTGAMEITTQPRQNKEEHEQNKMPVEIVISSVAHPVF